MLCLNSFQKRKTLFMMDQAFISQFCTSIYYLICSYKMCNYLKGYSRPQNNFRLKGSIWTIIKGKRHKKYKRKK